MRVGILSGVFFAISPAPAESWAQSRRSNICSVEKSHFDSGGKWNSGSPSHMLKVTQLVKARARQWASSGLASLSSLHHTRGGTKHSSCPRTFVSTLELDAGLPFCSTLGGMPAGGQWVGGDPCRSRAAGREASQ